MMGEQPYASEDVLQRALEEHPEVIAGSSTAGSRTGRLLLVKREMGVPGSEGGSSIWSLDHLFLDAEGVPVVVEVKRSSDTRIRREVVGQMLDYAANGVRYWPIENLRWRLSGGCSTTCIAVVSASVGAGARLRACPVGTGLAGSLPASGP